MPTTTVNPHPDIPLPVGAVFGGIWEENDPQPERLIFGPERSVTDTNLGIWTSAIQWVDGRMATEPEPPRVHIEGDINLNSDQARELAAVLLEAASELDRWLR
jgi:hypothetical protein